MKTIKLQSHNLTVSQSHNFTILQCNNILIREIMMGVGNRVASVIMLTFPSELCPHADS